MSSPTREHGLRVALRAIWSALTRAEERAALRDRRVTALENRIAALESGLGEERIPAARAGRILGVSTQMVRRLITAGDLEGLALQLPGRERRVWSVEVRSLERLISDATGVPGCPEPREIGRGRKAEGG